MTIPQFVLFSMNVQKINEYSTLTFVSSLHLSLLFIYTSAMLEVKQTNKQNSNEGEDLVISNICENIFIHKTQWENLEGGNNVFFFFFYEFHHFSKHFLARLTKLHEWVQVSYGLVSYLNKKLCKLLLYYIFLCT